MSETNNPLTDAPADRLPKHVAIIMDGNGRWAKARGLPRRRGHEEGAKSVRAVVEACQPLGIEYLTLYAFSTENWKRPKGEVNFLMTLLQRYLANERSTLMEKDVRFRVIGRVDRLPAAVQKAIATTVEACANNTSGTLCLALNYGARQEIIDAAKALAQDVAAGRAKLDEIDESAFARYLYTADMPDVDLLIRTANEMRVSNFLLWQISYAELYVTPTYWPDFRQPQLREALAEYAQRERRFGGLSSTGPVDGQGGA